MKTILYIIMSMISISSFAQVMWQLKDTENKKWYLQFTDEFDGEGLDETKWKSGMPWGNAQYVADNYFTPDNVVIYNHTLKLTSKKEPYKLQLTAWEIDSVYFKREKKPIPEYYTFDYTSGEISTRQQFKNGYFEIRFKTQKAYGMWPAFWLYGGAPNEEIDFFELKGERDNQIHVDMHCPDGCDNFRGGFLKLHRGWGGWVTAEDDLSEGWNIISGEWQKDFVKVFLNGRPIAYFQGEFKTSQYLLIGTGPAKTGGAFSPGPNKTTPWPNQLEVDYVRVWSAADTIYDIKDKYAMFEHSTKTIENSDLYKTDVKKKLNLVYNKKELSNERGTITLLPVFYNKYSLSIAGKNLGKIQVDVIDRFDQKAASYTMENTEYYVLDLSNLPTGPYKIKTTVLNQTLIHEVPVINPEKIGEERK